MAALAAGGFAVSSSRVEEARTSSDGERVGAAVTCVRAAAPTARADGTRARRHALTARAALAGSTTKLLVRLHDGLAVEAVLLRHDSGCGRYGDGPRPGHRRATLCLSSQAGCAMGCTFCATGTMGLQRNLSAGEIAEQAAHAEARGGTRLRNIVLMGMGEPLNNYAAVIAAIHLLTAPPRRGGFGIARGRVTVSTVGVVPRMRTLAADAPGVRLALSLHAPSQAEREAIVPSASTFPLPRLLEAADAHAAAPGGSPPLIEYVLLRGVNDTAAHSAALGALLAERRWSVNLIPYNRVPGSPHEPPAVADVVAFQAALRTNHGINATVRRTMGKVRHARRRARCSGLCLHRARCADARCAAPGHRGRVRAAGGDNKRAGRHGAGHRRLGCGGDAADSSCLSPPLERLPRMHPSRLSMMRHPDQRR